MSCNNPYQSTSLFVYREMVEGDIEKLSYKLQELGVYIIQIRNWYFSRDFFRQGLRDRRLNVLLALCDNNIIGWTIAIQESRSFWLSFMALHPVWGVRIAYRKLQAIFASSCSVVALNELRSSSATLAGAACSDVPMPHEVAAHIDISVASDFRRLGVASELQRLQLKSLKAKGIKRITASIAEWNTQSRQLHEKYGWNFHHVVGGQWQISKDL